MKKYLLLLLAIALAVIQKATAQTPVAYYPFSGNADDVIGSINGTVDGATLTTDRFGNANSAYSFDGVDDFIDIGSINFAGNDYSISFWVQLNSVTSDNAIFSGANPLFLTNTFVLSEINSGMGRFLHRNPAGTTGGVDLAGQQSIPLSNWTFISCVKQGTTLLYYVNGVLDNSVTNAAATNISSAIYVELGRLRNGSSTFIRYLNGKLDEVKIYNTALTASQVQNEYAINNQAQKPGSGNSISFDGLDDFINSGNSPAFALTNNLTLEVWVRPSAFAIVNQIFHKMGTGVNVDRTGYQLRYNNGNNIGFTIADASTIDGVSTTVTNDDLNKWMHIAATFDGTTLSLYKNGVLMNSKTTTQAITHIASEFLIGKRTDGFNFNGSLDEVRLWNTALNESQIRDRMCRKITSSDALYSNLVAYYNFDESTGTTAFDGTADANNGTLTNTPTRITSGAHIGNVSAHSYAGATSSINLAHPTIGDDLTVTLTTGGGDGVQVYCVTEAPNTTAGQVILPGNNGYFGVFPINGIGLQYTAEYNYDGITGIVNENGLKLYKRNDNAATSWINSNAALNTTNNTLIATGQNTEYMVGEDVAPNVVVSGALTGGFATVKEAFDAINAGGGSGAVTVTIIENTIETAIAQLNQTGYTVSVLPQGARVVTGSLPNDLILLDGADDVTINGQGLSGTNTLTIRNTSASVTSSTIRLINGANNNIIRKCIVECDANSSNVTSGAIVINASSSSNLAGNTIDSNLIRPVSAAGLRQGIVLAQQNTTVTGTINNTQITNNLLENVFVDNGTTGAFNILIQANCNNTVIRGNSVYATSPLINATNGNTWYGIAMFNTGNATGSGAVIDSNYFGGTAPAATGGNFTISSPLNSIGVRSIFVQDNVANPTIITKNVIRNFSIDAGNPTTATANPFVGVQISTGNLARLDSNTIGNISNGSVNVTMRPGSTGQTGCFGILTSVACANPIANNFFWRASYNCNTNRW